MRKRTGESRYRERERENRLRCSTAMLDAVEDEDEDEDEDDEGNEDIQMIKLLRDATNNMGSFEIESQEQIRSKACIELEIII
jgi:hypothetical protein